MKLFIHHLPRLARRAFPHLWLFCLLWLTLVGVSAPSVRAATVPQQSSLTLSVRAGFDGYFKDGQWVPVRITVANTGADVKATLRILTSDSSGQGEIAYTREVELPTQSRRELHLYVPLQTYANTLKVELVDSGNLFGTNNILAQNTASVRMVSATDALFGVVAGTPSAFNIFNSLIPLNGRTYVAQLELNDLPALAAALQSLDVLVFSDADTGALSPEQQTALASWVASGGKLLVAGGPSWQKTAVGLTDLLPLIPAGSQTLPALAQVASFANAAAPEGNVVVATGTLAPDAVVMVAEDTVPLVVMRSSGFGKVFYLAADPAFAPLKNWSGLENFYRQLVGGGDDRPGWWGGIRLWYNAYNALNSLPALALPSLFIICGFLGAYLLIIGPANYIVLRRIKRQEWAWLTIPAIVLVFSGLTYITGYGLRGTRPTLHQLAIVQVWPNAEYARVDEAVGLFSPRRADYDVAFAAGTLARPMPADSIGGAVTNNNYNVHQGDQTVFKGVRLDVGEVKPFVVQGQMPAPQFEAALTLDFSTGTPTLQGSITNRSTLTLKDAVLLAPGGSQRFGDFAPGQTVNVSLSFYNSRATAINGPATIPIIPIANMPAGANPGGYYSGAYDTTIDDIMGSTNYYDDRALYRRFMVLSSIMDQYNSGAARGNGVYLVGWDTAAPLAAQVVGQDAGTENQSVYFIKLDPSLNQGTGQLLLPPALMKWSVVNANSNSTPTAYDGYVYQGADYALRFEPIAGFRFSTVQRLTLHFNGYGSVGLVGDPRIDLWNYETATWEELKGLRWGDTDIPDPAHFVSPAGEIQVRVQGLTSNSISFENLDFTLEATP